MVCLGFLVDLEVIFPVSDFASCIKMKTLSSVFLWTLQFTQTFTLFENREEIIFCYHEIWLIEFRNVCHNFSTNSKSMRLGGSVSLLSDCAICIKLRPYCTWCLCNRVYHHPSVFIIYDIRTFFCMTNGCHFPLLKAEGTMKEAAIPKVTKALEVDPSIFKFSLT